MITLAPRHPAQLVLGSVILQEEIARKNGQMTFAILSHDAVGWATEVRDLVKEIGTDAQYGIDLCEEAKADNEITMDEFSSVETVLREIEEEARTGRIV